MSDLTLTDLPALPPGAVLLHIGPHKTGTTAIQSALAASRDALAGAGVRYPGRGNQHSREAMAVLERPFGFRERGGGSFPIAEWERLVTQTTRARGRVVISSEFFDMADRSQAERVCAELGRERVHVLITLRPFARLLPSSWQQFLKGGRAATYDTWLGRVFAEPDDAQAAPGFWVRHDHAALAERWAAAVGPDRVTVAMLDDRDQSWLFHLFERLLGLDEDFLTRPPGDRANRSMSAVECELLRRVNVHVSRQQVPWPDYQQVIRDGAFRRILTEREPGPDEARISTPEWALERSVRVGSESAQRIRELGVRVVGELDRLGERLPTTTPAALPDRASLRLAVQLVVGALSGSMRRGPDFGDVRAGWPPPAPALDGVPTRHLARVLRRRVVDRARRAASSRRRT